jgi:hypothetical protein
LNTNIFIPKKIKVGFQERSDTYTKKLAYIIYYDQANKLRKETSWQNWRSKDIEPEDYDNEPTSGFVLNKKVGGYQSYYNMRQTYTRVYDPRGFEFEITIPNLLYILENTSSIKGKGLEGEFVYGWDGKELLLIPTSAPEYQEMQNLASTLYDGEPIKAKDLVLGATYATATGGEWVYMGKSELWEYETNTYYETNEYHDPWYCVGRSRLHSGWLYPLDDTWEIDVSKEDRYRYKNIPKQKRFWFVSADGKNVWSLTSISKKFYGVTNPNVTDKFAEFQDILDHRRDYSPMNYSASVVTPYTYDEFVEFAESIEFDGIFNRGDYFYTNNGRYEYMHRNASNKNEWYITLSKKQSLKEIYEEYKPQRVERYLMNGKLCKDRY